ncbi:MAG: hypothetical protein AVDCRST_MAG88-147, partial [uncultured Thermomicrobiales bacterium]
MLSVPLCVLRTLPPAARRYGPRRLGHTRPAARLALLVALLTALALLAPPAPAARAATFSVTTTAESGPGSLRQAILDANGTPGGDTITFGVTGTITLASALPTITGDLAITGPGAGNLTISGAGLHRVFFTDSGTVSIARLTIADGLAQGGTGGSGVGGGGGGAAGLGGGLLINGGAVTLDGVTFANNQARGGNGGNQACCGFRSGGGGGGVGGPG